SNGVKPPSGWLPAWESATRSPTPSQGPSTKLKQKAWQLSNHPKNPSISSKPDRAYICTIIFLAALQVDARGVMLGWLLAISTRERNFSFAPAAAHTALQGMLRDSDRALIYASGELYSAIVTSPLRVRQSLRGMDSPIRATESAISHNVTHLEMGSSLSYVSSRASSTLSRRHYPLCFEPAASSTTDSVVFAIEYLNEHLSSHAHYTKERSSRIERDDIGDITLSLASAEIAEPFYMMTFIISSAASPPILEMLSFFLVLLISPASQLVPLLQLLVDRLFDYVRYETRSDRYHTHSKESEGDGQRVFGSERAAEQAMVLEQEGRGGKARAKNEARSQAAGHDKKERGQLYFNFPSLMIEHTERRENRVRTERKKRKGNRVPVFPVGVLTSSSEWSEGTGLQAAGHDKKERGQLYFNFPSLMIEHTERRENRVRTERKKRKGNRVPVFPVGVLTSSSEWSEGTGLDERESSTESGESSRIWLEKAMKLLHRILWWHLSNAALSMLAAYISLSKGLSLLGRNAFRGAALFSPLSALKEGRRVGFKAVSGGRFDRKEGTSRLMLMAKIQDIGPEFAQSSIGYQFSAGLRRAASYGSSLPKPIKRDVKSYKDEVAGEPVAGLNPSQEELMLAGSFCLACRLLHVDDSMPITATLGNLQVGHRDLPAWYLGGPQYDCVLAVFQMHAQEGSNSLIHSTGAVVLVLSEGRKTAVTTINNSGTRIFSPPNYLLY
ncbi:hypothetical protein Tco_1345262, partial [Tanacetum coccineum]